MGECTGRVKHQELQHSKEAMTLYHDLAARQTRRCIAEICEQIRQLEKQQGTEYEIAMLRARKHELKEELIEYTLWGIERK
jgi:hypothetical protein